MKMKKAKLFMMLALLVMGVSNTFGYTYRVLFESGAVDGGYTVNANQNVVTSGDNELVLVSSQQLTANNIGNYITAKPVTGNTAGFVLDTSAGAKYMGTKDNGSFDGVIFITYKYNSTVTVYNESDTNFDYSNIYTAIYGRNYGTESDGSPRVESQIYLGENKVAISLKNTRLENATIPVTDPNGRTVVAIQRFGMTYSQTPNYSVKVYNCSDYYTNDNYHDYPNNRNSTYYDYVNYYSQNGQVEAYSYDHRNEYLKTITFAPGSKVASIGDYAFVCCTQLTEVNNIPSELAFLGQAAFSTCEKLTKVDFPIRSELKTIRDFTFWHCYGLKRLSLPEGIEEIEGQTPGGAMQYMTGLEDLHLPNTLKRVGPHFLCCASSLKTLTIPVSVEYIDGAFLHGCESLETVYILGPAATLKNTSSSDDSPAFSQNYTLCKDPVNNCTFYTTSDNLAAYQNNSVWNKINNNGVWDRATSGYTRGWGNYLKAIPGETRTLPDRWVTAVFPAHPDDGDYKKIVKKSDFGTGTKVAKMTQCTGYDHQEIDGKVYRVYHLNFTEIAEGDDAVIPKGVPLLIKAGRETSYVFYQTAEQGQDWFKTHATVPHEVTVHCNQDGADITMKGQYSGLNIQPGEVYFKNNKEDFTYDEDGKRVEHPKFLLAPETGYVTIDPCRCWWTIEQDGHIVPNTSAGLAKGSRIFNDDETTGIKEVETRFVIDGIYDLNGHKMDVKQEDLPQGLFIINGKKVLKK